jgi:hypothetical protein
MAIKIQLRRDTAINWVSNNPLLLNGEIGIETDTLRFKVGNGSQRWNEITSYALKPGLPNGVASLDDTGKVPSSQLPDLVLDNEILGLIQNEISQITTSSISEGLNLYFTQERVVNAGSGVFDISGSAANAIAAAATNTANKISDLINSAPEALNTLSELSAALEENSGSISNIIDLISEKSDIVYVDQEILSLSNLSSQDATTKANAAQTAAIAAAAADATTKANAAQTAAIAAAAADATTKSSLSKSESIAEAATDATTKANAAQTAAIAAAAADATTKANAAQTAAIAAAAEDATLKSNEILDQSTFYSNQKYLDAIEAANLHAEGFIESSIDLITTSEIEEGSNLYFTDLRAKEAVAPEIANAIASIPGGGSNISSTTDLAEGTNLYFTNARAISATNNARTAILISANSTVDDLRVEINNSLNSYALISDRNADGGYSGLDSSGKILESSVPTSIARSADVAAQIASLVGSAPETLNTLSELATALEQNSGSTDVLTTLVETKLSSELASETYLSKLNAADQYATKSLLSESLIPYSTKIVSEAYTDSAIAGINNSLDSYVLDSDRNLNGGFAGLDSSGKILSSALPTITNSMLQNNFITVNGSAISLGSSVITGYTNGVSGSNVNKISYGTNATPPSSGNAAGDIYIQY